MNVLTLPKKLRNLKQNMYQNTSQKKTDTAVKLNIGNNIQNKIQDLIKNQNQNDIYDLIDAQSQNQVKTNNEPDDEPEDEMVNYFSKLMYNDYSTLTQDEHIDRIVRITIAKKMRKLFGCSISNDLVSELNKKVCLSTFTNPLISKYFRVPMVENGQESEREVWAPHYLLMLSRYLDNIQVNNKHYDRSRFNAIFDRYKMFFTDHIAFNFSKIDKLNEKTNETVQEETFEVVIPSSFETKTVNDYSTFIRNNSRKNVKEFSRHFRSPHSDSSVVFQHTLTAKNGKNGEMEFEMDKEFVEDLFFKIIKSIMDTIDDRILVITCAVKENYKKQNGEMETGTHSLMFLCQYYQDQYHFFAYDPHGYDPNGKGTYNTRIEDLQKKLEIIQGNQYKTFEFHYQTASCPINIQAEWEDPIGYCMYYNLLWLDCILYTIVNIKQYSEIMKMPDLISIPVHLWIRRISVYLNKVEDIIDVYFNKGRYRQLMEYKQQKQNKINKISKQYVDDEISKMSEKELDDEIKKLSLWKNYPTSTSKLEIILRFIMELRDEYRIKYHSDGKHMDFEIARDSYEVNANSIRIPKDPTINTVGKRYKPNEYSDSDLVEIITTGGYSDHDFELSQYLSKPVKDKMKFADKSFGNYDNYKNVDTEKTIELKALKEFLKEDYDKICHSDNDCDNSKMKMKCDILNEDIDDPNNIAEGICIPEKKHVWEGCNNDDDCLSGYCDNQTCRAKIYGIENEFQELREENSETAFLNENYSDRLGKPCTINPKTKEDSCHIPLTYGKQIRLPGDTRHFGVPLKCSDWNFCVPQDNSVGAYCESSKDCISNNCYHNKCRRIDTNEMYNLYLQDWNNL